MRVELQSNRRGSHGHANLLAEHPAQLNNRRRDQGHQPDTARSQETVTPVYDGSSVTAGHDRPTIPPSGHPRFWPRSPREGENFTIEGISGRQTISSMVFQRSGRRRFDVMTTLHISDADRSTPASKPHMPEA